MERLVGRHAGPVVTEMLASFRLVVLGGARQTGKSTLVADLLGFPASARFTSTTPPPGEGRPRIRPGSCGKGRGHDER